MKTLLILVGFFLTVAQSSTLFITQDHVYTKASGSMEFFTDTHDEFTVETIAKAPWQKMHTSNLDSLTSLSSWTRFSLKNTSQSTKRLILKNPNASMSEIDVFIFKNDLLIRHNTLGSKRAKSLREVPHRYSLFPINLEANEEVQIVTQLANTIGSVEGEWEVYSHQSFADFSIFESMWWGVFIGMYCIVFLYVRPFLLIIKNKTLIFAFTFFGIACLGYQLAINGIFYTLGMNVAYIDSMSLFFGSMFRLATVFIVFNLIFISYSKSILFKAFGFFVAFLSVVFVLSFFTLIEAKLVTTIAKISLFSGLLSYVVWFLMAKDIFKLARSKPFVYLLSAYTIILIPNAYQSLVTLGLLDISFFSIYSVSIASLINIYLFALAVLEYIKHVESERIQQEKITEIHMHYASIGKIIGNIAHQWKVPLVRSGSLLTHAEALIANKDASALAEIDAYIIPTLRTNLDFMKETIDTFYTLYKGENIKKSFNPAEVLAGIWSMLSAKAVAVNIKLHKTIDPNMHITSYEHHFGHLMMILLDNAIDAANERKMTQAMIFVNLSHDGNQLTISVEDTCGGITQEPLSSIFDVDVTSKLDDTEQRGRGLYIFKLLLETKFCGSVTLSNTQNGARFDIIIPFTCRGGEN